MDLNRASNDPEFASALCDLVLDHKQGLSVAVRTRHAEEFMNGPCRFTGGPITRYVPSYQIFLSDTAALITITGATTAEAVQYIVGSYLQTRDNRLPVGFTPAAQAAAQVIGAALVEFGGRTYPRIIIGGYSWGGAVAVALAAGIRNNPNPPLLTVCTFGAPKPGDDRLGLAIQGIDLTRYMNVGDYVCLFPPAAGNAAIMYNLLPASGYHNCLENQQVGRGQLIDADYNISNAIEPPAPDMFTELSLANFLISNAAPVSQFHALETYALRLQHAPRPAAGVVNGGGAANNAAQQVSPRSGPRSPRSGVAALAPAPIVDSVRAPLAPTAPANPYYSTRANGVPVVQYLGVTIAVCRGSKAARNLARSLNTSWRRWNLTRVGDATALTHSVQDLFVD